MTLRNLSFLPSMEDADSSTYKKIQLVHFHDLPSETVAPRTPVIHSISGTV